MVRFVQFELSRILAAVLRAKVLHFCVTMFKDRMLVIGPNLSYMVRLVSVDLLFVFVTYSLTF